MFAGSWKTTSAGITAIIGALVHLYFNRNNLNEESIMIGVGGILAGVGLIFARDNDKTSEQVGLTPTPIEKPPPLPQNVIK